MTITEKSFILVEKPTGTIIVDNELEQLLRKEMRPILWFRKGLSCVVPVEILINALDYMDIKLGSTHKSSVTINWKQCWPITDGRPMTVLAGLDY